MGMEEKIYEKVMIKMLVLDSLLKTQNSILMVIFLLKKWLGTEKCKIH